MPIRSEETGKPTGSSRGGGWRRTWLSPTGISGIAAVVALFIGAATLAVQMRDSTPPQAGGPQVSETAGVERAALFVYGTSMPGMTRYASIGPYVTGSTPDSVDGLLYDSGLGYPLAKFVPGGEVPGVVLWLDPATAEVAMTEMTRVEAGLFQPRAVRTRSGVTAQAFEWIGATDDLPRIEAWDGTRAHFGEAVPWPSVEEGDCFQPTEDADRVLLVWCEAPHPWEVSFSGRVKTAGAGVRETADAACDEAHADYIGRPKADSDLAVRIFHDDSATDGGLQVLCGVGEAGALTRGSLQHSDR